MLQHFGYFHQLRPLFHLETDKPGALAFSFSLFQLLLQLSLDVSLLFGFGLLDLSVEVFGKHWILVLLFAELSDEVENGTFGHFGVI